MSHQQVVSALLAGRVVKQHFARARFIRYLRPNDARAVVAMLESEDITEDECEVRFGIFDMHGELVNLFEESDDAFKTYAATPYRLTWLQ